MAAILNLLRNVAWQNLVERERSTAIEIVRQRTQNVHLSEDIGTTEILPMPKVISENNITKPFVSQKAAVESWIKDDIFCADELILGI